MRKFTPEEDNFIRDNYLILPLKRISKMLGRSESSARQRLHLLGLTVPKEIAQKFKKQSQYQPGRTPENKGKKQSEFMSQEGIERTKSTRFKTGHEPHNTKFDGHERISKDGYIEIRVKKGKYALKHRWMWEQKHGKIPPGHIVIFKDADRMNIQLDNLELISRDENAIRNKLAPNYPREIQKAEYLLTKIKRKTNGKK